MTSSSHELLVPLALCGTHREARQAWRKIIRRVIKARSWSNVLSEIDWIPLAQCPGKVNLHGPDPTLVGKHVMCYPILTDLLELSYMPDREAWYQHEKELVFDQLHAFWFCLGVLAMGAGFPKKTSFDAEKAQMAIAILRAVMHWWPILCSLESRYYLMRAPYDSAVLPWYEWGHIPRVLCVEGGMPIDEVKKLDRVDAVAAGSQIQKWLTTQPGATV